MVSCKLIQYFHLFVMLNNFFSASDAQSENTAQPEVTILQGTLQGTTLKTIHGRNITAFLGIPYAQPPTGNLRFANPIAATGWNGTRNASIDGNECPQISDGTVIGDEDCLHLNVYAAQLPQNSSVLLLPVMVYIHGGAFRTGSSVSTSFGPEYILDEDIIFVSCNYRLGPLGFLSTGDEVASGNWGLKDQVLALQWVQNNIENFGGDPSQVTLFGQSAGSVSVHLLSLSNMTNGLFHRYITQSGSALATWAHRSRTGYARIAFEFGELLGCSNGTTDSLISCLRMVDSSDIIAQTSLYSILWSPTDEPDIEGAILTDSPTNLFAAGQIRDLPWICGVTRDEGLMFTMELYEDDEAFANFLEDFDSSLANMLDYGDKSDGGAVWIEAIKTYYFNNDLSANKTLILANLTNVASDSSFFYPAHNALQRQLALAASPQYFYNFNYRGTYSFTWKYSGSSVNYGVHHSDEMIYLFPMRDRFGNLTETLSETDYEMIDNMVKLWTSFAINGTPSVSSLTTWEPYSMIADNYLRMGNESDATLEEQNSFLEERMQFWANLVDTTETSNTAADDSGSVTLISYFPFVLLLIYSGYFL